MNQTPNQSMRPGFVLTLLIVISLLGLLCKILPMLGGSKKPVLLRVVNNLKQIDLAKQWWALDHGASNGVQVSFQDLAPYLGQGNTLTGVIVSVLSETYTPNPIGIPPEARLGKGVGRFPKDTSLRWSTNRGSEVLLPSLQGESNNWQPTYSITNRTPAAAVSGRSLN